MHQTFEEQLAGELDTLYQGALFLTGADARGAERLLVRSVCEAFAVYEAHHGSSADFGRWMEGRIVRCFTEGLPAASVAAAVRDVPEPARTAPADFQGLEGRALFEGARAVPPPARAALWLVMLRRWTYAEAARALNVDPSELATLLTHRATWMAELARRGNVTPRASAVR